MRERFQGSPGNPFARTVCSAAEAGCTGLFLVLVASPLHTFGQSGPDGPDAGLISGEIAPHELATATVSPAKSNEWVVVPIPTLNPSQGFGLQVLGQYIFKPADQEAGTPASIVGLGGFYNERKSWGAFGGYMGHWQNDLWRPAFGGGYGDVNYDFYGIGNVRANDDKSVPVDQQATFGLVQLLRRWLPGFYAGLRFTASHTEGTSAELNEPPVVLPPLAFSVTTYSGAFIAQWDTRDNQFYPTAGQYANLSASFYEGDDAYQVYKFDWNCYHALGDRAVIAVRLFLRSTDGNAPFYALSSFGQHNDLRGYKSGKYRDRDQVTTQVEYRQKLSPRWGFVAFAGVGEVASSFDDMNADDLLPSVGAGLRFRVADSHPVNLRFDWAYGDEHSFYLGVGEAF